MTEKISFNPEGKERKLFPYELKNPEAVKITEQVATDEKIAGHLEFLKKHHLPSFEHCMRVGTLSTDLSIENGLDEEEIKTVAAGGVLHDLGKCFIPIEILNKDSALTEEELKTIKSHTRLGFEQLSDPAFDGIREIVVSHHEFTTDRNYPRTLNDRRNGERNGNGSRRKKDSSKHTALVAVADIFDALSEKRPYNPVFSYEEIKKIIEEKYSGPKEYIEQILQRFKKL